MKFWIKRDSKGGCREREESVGAVHTLEPNGQSRAMAGALSENAPRPVSVVAIGGATVDNARNNPLNRPQVTLYTLPCLISSFLFHNRLVPMLASRLLIV